MTTSTFPSAPDSADKSGSPPERCSHHVVTVGGLHIIACPDCGDVSFQDSRGPVAGRVGLARLFGQFDLIGSLAALGAPAREVLAYRAPNARSNRVLRSLPAGVWLKGDEGLWLAHDGEHLLLAHGSPWVTRHLLDGA